MQTLQGIAVSPGVAIGEALVVDDEGFRIPRRFIDSGSIEQELERLSNSIAAVAIDLERNRDSIEDQLGQQYGAIFSAQRQMVCDPKLKSEIESLLRTRRYSPEYAVTRTLRRYAKVFQTLDNSHIAERAHDIVDIEKRLLRNLLGQTRTGLAHLTAPIVLLTHNLTPSEAANLNRDFVLGFASEVGGAGGHTAIVAKALEIPAVVGLGQFLSDVGGGELIIIDGDEGQIVLNPDEETISRYRDEAAKQISISQRLESIRDLPPETTDGTRVTLSANIEFPREVEACNARGADGVGLYRTEFLYLASQQIPTEEDHFQAYRYVVENIGDKPVVIRTLDLGADKLSGLEDRVEERNPFLGLRSIRLALRNIPLFRTQLRAVMRASSLGDLRIMFPLVSTLHELRRAKSVLADVMEDLEEEGIEFDRQPSVGIMVEVPATVMMLDRFVKETDFLSIGTNDLIQYALAVDRSNKEVASLYSASDPSVIRLIDMTLRIARENDTPATLCGQMSDNPIYTALLLGLGLRSMSVPPSAVPEIKHTIRSLSLAQCEEIADKVREMESANEVTSYLNQEMARNVPAFA